MYNPCQYCGELPQVQSAIDVPLCICKCGNTSFEQYWNLNNPLPEIDEVAELESKLAECYELLDIVAMSSYVDFDIRAMVESLLKKHRGN